MKKERLAEVYGDVWCYATQPGSKAFKAGKPRVHPLANGNKAGRNGTGGIVVIDVDIRPDRPDVSANFDSFCAAFPGVAETETMRVTSRTEGAFHLVYSWPEEYPYPAKSIAPGTVLGRGIEMPPYYMLPGSVVDGRKYTATRHSVKRIPDSLALAILRNDATAAVSERPARRAVDTETQARELLATIASAPPGERNAVYTRVAFPLLGLLGEDEFCERLAEAWPGDDTEDELLQRAKSTVEAYSGGYAEQPSRVVSLGYSRHRHCALVDLVERVRLGRWEGRTAATDRRVMLALALKALAANAVTVDCPVETLAREAGIYPKDVRKALRRLQARELVSFPSRRSDKPSEDYLGTVCLVRPVLVGLYGLGGNTPLQTHLENEYKYPYEAKEVIGPLHPVWRHGRLQGRHAHLFDLIDSGTCTRVELASVSGVGPSTVKDTVARLIESGLVVDGDEGLAVADGVDAVVSDLCADGEVYAVYSRISAAIDKEHDRLDRWKAETEGINLAVESRRELEDEQLCEQLEME